MFSSRRYNISLPMLIENLDDLINGLLIIMFAAIICAPRTHSRFPIDKIIVQLQEIAHRND